MELIDRLKERFPFVENPDNGDWCATTTCPVSPEIALELKAYGGDDGYGMPLLSIVYGMDQPPITGISIFADDIMYSYHDVFVGEQTNIFLTRYAKLMLQDLLNAEDIYLSLHTTPETPMTHIGADAAKEILDMAHILLDDDVWAHMRNDVPEADHDDLYPMAIARRDESGNIVTSVPAIEEKIAEVHRRNAKRATDA